MEAYIYLLIFLLNLFIYYYYNKLPFFLKAFDSPISRIKTHKVPIPLSGGLATCITILCISLIGEFSLYNNLVITFCLFAVYTIGFLDDLHFLSPLQRITLLSLIFLLLLYFEPFFMINEIKIYDFKISVNIILGTILTLFSFVAVLNAFNFIDGIDGLSSLLCINIFIFCLLLDFVIDYNILVLILALSYYLYFNFRKKSFLGDSGIYILSSYIFLYLLTKYQLDDLSLTQIVLLLSYPGLDLLIVSILRIKNKKKMYSGDRNHLHHLLFDCYGLAKSLIILLAIFWIPNLIFNFLNIDFEIIFIVFIIFYLFIINKLIKKRGLKFK